jgi:2-polyprenyl-6-hydroxyphenyl methylase/3-demethylubiquinone-9 3-methyltransferase
MFSSYSERFWEERLAWFEAQAAAGLIGAIDRERTGDGVIVCRDGLTLGAVGPDEFAELALGLEAELESVEVDESCWFHLLRRASGKTDDHSGDRVAR